MNQNWSKMNKLFLGSNGEVWGLKTFRLKLNYEELECLIKSTWNFSQIQVSRWKERNGIDFTKFLSRLKPRTFWTKQFIIENSPFPYFFDKLPEQFHLFRWKKTRVPSVSFSTISLHFARKHLKPTICVYL